jgi:hypothetical protein
MNPLIRDFYGHQVWADAEHWRAIEGHPPAAADTVIRDRLHHIHLVQRAFRWIVGDRQSTFTITKPEDFATAADLKAYAREYHDEIVDFLGGLSDARLASEVNIEWFKDPPPAPDGHRSPDAVRDAQPLPSRPERDAPAQARWRAAGNRLDRVVLEGPSGRGLARLTRSGGGG